MSERLVEIIITLSIIFIFLGTFLGEFSYLFEDINLNPNDYARITDVEYKAIVLDEPDTGGSILVTERLTFDVHAAYYDNRFWELWRDLCEDYVDGLHVSYTVNSVKQIYKGGREVIYEESPKLYWDDSDFLSSSFRYGPGKWFHSPGPYNEYARRYECVFFYVDGIYREQVVFEIEYIMHNAALRYNDCSELYISLFSEDSVNHLNSFKADFLFPDKDMPAKGNYDVFTYGTNSNDFPYTESATKYPGYYTFSFDLNKEDLQFKPYNEYIEFNLVSHGDDRHIFTEHAPDNYYSNDNVLDELYAEQQDYETTPARYRIIKLCILALISVSSAIVVRYALNTPSRISSRHAFFAPENATDYYRDIPSDLDPNFAAALVFCKHKKPKDDSGVYSAILLSLARKKYIKLMEMSSNDVLIRITYTPKEEPVSVNTNIYDVEVPVHETSALYSIYNEEPTDSITEILEQQEAIDAEDYPEYEPLTMCEQYYFNLIVHHAVDNQITMSSLQYRVANDYSHTNTFVNNMDNSIVNIGINELYFQKADYEAPKNALKKTATVFLVIGIVSYLANIITYHTRLDFAFGAFFIWGTACTFAAYYINKLSCRYVLLTPFGETEYAKWRGLYNFLSSGTLISERTMVELPIWEKYLVYATAFGLPDKIIESISLNCPDPTPSPILSNRYCSSRSFRSSGRSFRHSVRVSTGSYGGGFGGFGYGGGGRGGGGGGGGH